MTDIKAKTPEEVIADIRESEHPKHVADEIARALLEAHGKRQDEFWFRTEHNLLALILLYVAKAEGYMSVNMDAGFKDYTERQASDVLDLICSDPHAVSEVIKAAIDRSEKDSDLLKHHYCAWRMGRNWESIYSNLANEIYVREFFDKEGAEQELF